MKRLFLPILIILMLFSFFLFASAETDKVCPEDFGAVGDGITDDTAAMFSAIKTGKIVSGKEGSVYKLHSMYLGTVMPYYIENCDFYIDSAETYTNLFNFYRSTDIHIENCNFSTTADQVAGSTVGFFMKDTESRNTSNICFIYVKNEYGEPYNMTVKNCIFENSGLDINTKGKDENGGVVTIENCRSYNSVQPFMIQYAEVFNISGCYFNQNRAGSGLAHCIYFDYNTTCECNVKDCWFDYCTSGAIQCNGGYSYTLNVDNCVFMNPDDGEHNVINIGRNSSAYLSNCKIYAPEGNVFGLTMVSDNSNTYCEAKNCDIYCRTANKYSATSEEKYTNMCFDSCNMTITKRGFCGYNNIIKNCNVRQLKDTESYITWAQESVVSDNYIQIDTSRMNSLRFTGDSTLSGNEVVFGGENSPYAVAYTTGENNTLENNNFYSWSSHVLYTKCESVNINYYDTPNTQILKAGWLFCSAVKDENEVFFDNENKTINAIIFGSSADYPDIAENYEATPIDVAGSGAIAMYSVPDCNGKTQKVYILSDDVIYINPSASNMFNGFSALETLIFENVDFSSVRFTENVWKNSDKVKYVYGADSLFTDKVSETKPEISIHNYTTATVSPTCTEDGEKKTYCIDCGNVKSSENIPAIGHKVSNEDGVCDICGAVLITVDPPLNCSCNCHKSGFMGFIWKILRIFYKLFRINPTCACGASHY